MAVMWVFSMDTFAAQQTQQRFWPTVHAIAPQVSYPQYRRLHRLAHKAAHLLEYALLACLLLRAFRAGAVDAWHWRWAIHTCVLVALYAGLDEYHQTYTRYRTGSVADSMLDMAGGLLALACLWLSRRPPAGHARHSAGGRHP
jgi:VanZ family protein